MLRRDLWPYAVLAGALALIAAALVVPASRAWLADEAWSAVRAQAEGRGGSYSLGSLAFWALVGLAFAWPAYDLVFVRLGYATDRRFFLALAPFLLAAPLAHALLVVGAFPDGSALAYAATEPPIYLTTAVLIVAALAGGRLLGRPLLGAGIVGGALLGALAYFAAPRLDASSLTRVGLIALLAALPTAALAYAFVRWKKGEALDAVAAVIGAHALDGATTWMVLRDPFGLGFEHFSEKNPVSQWLVELSNGWPFFAMKLALPIVLLAMVKRDETEPRTHAFLLLAVFVLGYGPGMANLLQVLLA